MAKKKKWGSKKANITLGNAEKCHLLIGCCLLGAGCKICYGGHGVARDKNKAPYTLKKSAETAWNRTRDHLLTLWTDPAGPDPAITGFSVEQYRGAGRSGLPAWAQIHFEGAKIPKLNRAWPADIKRVWKELRDAPGPKGDK